MKLRRNNEYMFQVVECNTYMKRIKDGKYIRHSEQYSDVYYYVDENAEEKERKVEPEEWGGSDFVKNILRGSGEEICRRCHRYEAYYAESRIVL